MLGFLESGYGVYIIAVFCAIGVVETVAADRQYRKMIRQTENMLSVRHPFLVQIKNKFENTYRLNVGINNVELFIVKSMRECRMFGMNLSNMGKMANQMAMVCYFLAGVFALTGYLHGISTRSIILYLAFGAVLGTADVLVSYIADTENKEELLVEYLQEYMENTMINRIKNSRDEERVMSTSSAKSTETESQESSMDKSSKILPFSRASGKSIVREKEETGRRSAEGTKARSESIADRVRDRDSEREYTREEIAYLKQSLDRIASSRESDSDRRERKRKLTEKEERMIEDILKEYFV